MGKDGAGGPYGPSDLKKIKYQSVDTDTIQFIVDNLNDMICSGEDFLYEIHERMKKQRPELFDDKGYLRINAR